MSYPDFLREVWKSVNKPGRAVSAESFDNAIIPAVRRMNPELISKIEKAYRDGTLTSGHVPALLRFLEIHWSATQAPRRTT